MRERDKNLIIEFMKKALTFIGVLILTVVTFQLLERPR